MRKDHARDVERTWGGWHSSAQPILSVIEGAQTREPLGTMPGEVRLLIEEYSASPLRAWRTHFGMTLELLAERSGLNVVTLKHLDAGQVTICKWTADIVARALGNVSASSILKAQALHDLYWPDFPTVQQQAYVEVQVPEKVAKGRVWRGDGLFA